MSSLEAITLNDSPLPSVQVSYSVVFNILNAFNRRNSESTRIIGTLLGEVKENVVHVTESFVVPFIENVEEHMVQINADYHKSMYHYHRRNNKKEQVVGWFSTSTSTGALVIDNCSLVHDFYTAECNHPHAVHVVVDTTLAAADALMSVRSFVARDYVLDKESLSVAFHELKTSVVPASDAEATLVHQLLKGQLAGRKFASATVVAELSDIKAPATEAGAKQVRKATEALIELISGLQQYVELVQEGKVEANREVGILINEAIALYGAQPLQPAQIAALQTRSQDLLMVAYLASSAQVQTTLAEKVNQIL